VAAALRFYHKLWADGVIPSSAKTDDGTNILSLFEAGKIGMLGNGSFAYSELTAKYPNLHYAATFIPGEHGGWASFAGGDDIAIPKGTRNMADAWQFLQWVTSKQVQFNYLAKYGVVPVRSDALPSRYARSHPIFNKLVEAMAKGRTVKSVVYTQIFEDPTGPWIRMIQKAVFTGDIRGAISLGQTGFAAILAKQ
jgi:multiple sugar transport system substrate-binding protein